MKKVLIIIMTLTISNVLAQQKNYFTNKEVDLLYYKLQERKQLLKGNNYLKISLKYSDSLVSSLEKKGLIYQDVIKNQSKQISLLDGIIKQQEKKANNNKKIYKRKSFFNILKGVAIGLVGGVLIFS